MLFTLLTYPDLTLAVGSLVTTVVTRWKFFLFLWLCTAQLKRIQFERLKLGAETFSSVVNMGTVRENNCVLKFMSLKKGRPFSAQKGKRSRKHLTTERRLAVMLLCKIGEKGLRKFTGKMCVHCVSDKTPHGGHLYFGLPTPLEFHPPPPSPWDFREFLTWLGTPW